MTLRKIIWLGPAVFLIHDLEEVFWTQPWIEKNRFLFEDTRFERVIEAMGYQPAKFGLVVALITILYGIISYFATRQIQAGLSMNLYVSTILILFVNVFTHAGQTVLLGMYTPGVVTAVLVVLPYTVIAFRTLKAHHLLTRTTWKTSPFMSVGMLAVIFGLMMAV
ncbi:HXXEE domain-containing protein [Brevibacillus massiliensis]|uniref:HXXEE domain-containing protein n=1 Tax=Brevibacillus massiliensis TaxID=1118054 RepID=UPI0002F63BE4|nr:HXXEE domain-containing protein [Brevibacillus massiliensis]